MDSTHTLLPRKTAAPVIGSSFKGMCNVFCTLANSKLSSHRLSSCTRLMGQRIGRLRKMSHIRLCNGHSRYVGVSLLRSHVTGLNIGPTRMLTALGNRGGAACAKCCRGNRGHVHIAMGSGFGAMRSVKGVLVRKRSSSRLHLDSVTHVRGTCRSPAHGRVFCSRRHTLNVLVTTSDNSSVVGMNRTMRDGLRRLGTRHLPTKIRYRGVFCRPRQMNDSLKAFIVGLVRSIVVMMLVLVVTVKFGDNLVVNVDLIVAMFNSFLFLCSTNKAVRHMSLTTFMLTVNVLMSGTVIVVSNVLMSLGTNGGQVRTVATVKERATVPLLNTALVTVVTFLPVCVSPSATNICAHSLFVMLTISLLLD